jgi:hypothetical protein
MSARTIINQERPQTQTVDAIKALLSWRGRASDPLPSFVELGKEESRLVLVLSNKKDCFYVTTARACSCPAAIYNHGPCKHQRKHFAELIAKPAASEPGSIRPAGKWPGGMNGPVDPDELKRPARGVATSSSFEMVDTTPDATPGELAYHSIQADRDMWPAEA